MWQTVSGRRGSKRGVMTAGGMGDVLLCGVFSSGRRSIHQGLSEGKGAWVCGARGGGWFDSNKTSAEP